MIRPSQIAFVSSDCLVSSSKFALQGLAASQIDAPETRAGKVLMQLLQAVALGGRH